MLVTVLEQLPKQPGWVTIAADGVRGTVRWTGPQPPPAGGEVEVQLTVTEPVRWSDAVRPTAAPQDVGGLRLQVRATVAALERGGVVILEAGGSSFMIKTLDGTPIGVVHREHTFVLGGVEAYPVG